MIDFDEQAMIFTSRPDASEAMLSDLLERVWKHGYAQGQADGYLQEILVEEIAKRDIDV